MSFKSSGKDERVKCCTFKQEIATTNNRNNRRYMQSLSIQKIDMFMEITFLKIRFNAEGITFVGVCRRLI